MMDGVIIDLLNAKWNSFVKFRWQISPDSVVFTICQVRLVAEAFTVAGSVLYLLGAGRELWFLGGQTFFESLMTVPSRVLFLSSCIFIVVMVPLRFTCSHEAEDIVAILVMLTTALYFLFFCRGFKMVGPFVVMVYMMILGDLLRFVTIYLVFVIGFSQAFYIIFQSYRGDEANNYFQDPVASIMAMFVMSLQDFGDIYNEFNNTSHDKAAKFLFIIYMALVAILLINMLIAMMGTTYQIIAETHNEWQRQWARIVLLVERGVSPKDRLSRQMLYSQTMADGRRAFVLRHQMTDEDKVELKQMQEMKLTHIKYLKRHERGRPNARSPKKIIKN